tara:strand:+ start:9819 stop:10898 length:1080 start_codon:yes stop_codon:yes gene_type:complete
MGKNLFEKEQQNTPFFSILIPSYNRPEYIIKCLNSVISNDFQDFEIVISDDYSQSSKEIENKIKPYLKKHKIRFYSQKNNLKEPGNKNFLVSKAIGKFNIMLCDDDMLFHNSLSTIYKYITLNPGNDIYLFGYSVIDELDRFIYKRSNPSQFEINHNQTDLIKEFLNFDIFPFWFFHPAMFCCKEGLEIKNKYSSNVGIGEDFMFLIELLKNKNKMFVIPKSLLKWRKIINSQNVKQINQSLGYFNNIIARRKILNELINTKGFNNSINSYLKSIKFRRIFLYRQMKILNIKNNFEDINLNKELWAEYQYYSKKTNIFTVKCQSYLSRCIKYISIFGIKGLFSIMKICFDRFLYKIYTN